MTDPAPHGELVVESHGDVELSPDAVVLRVIRRSPHCFPPDSTRPGLGAFELSTQDRTDAQARGIAPRLSVFDKAKTKPAEARAFRTCTGRLPVYGMRVSDVTAISTPGRIPPALAVVPDPLIGNPRPGADGHCGIVGLDRPVGEPSTVTKSLRSQLADICFLEEDDP